MQRRPNVLLIHCHDLGRHLSCYGAKTVNSPRLDRLSALGVTAERMFASAPQCSPSRASLFTGRWPHSNGVMGLTHADFAWDLHEGERHLATRLRDVGYRTELIGVHHESRVKEDHLIAEDLGFDSVRTGGAAPEVAERTNAALDRLADSEGPFYLQVGFHEPHRIPGRQDPPGIQGFIGDHMDPDDSLGVDVPPYLRPDASAREEIAELQGAIRYMDAGVGQILDRLDALDLTDDTLTIFTTDHGLALPRAKCSLYDPGLEVAFIAHWPGGGWTGGRRLTDLLGNVDVVPTLLEALGIEVDGAPQSHIQGRSFLGLLDGEAGAGGRTEIFGEMTYHDYYDPRRCVRTDRYKLIANFSSAPGFMDPSQSWQHRCTAVDEGIGHEDYHPAVELYDLHADPVELDNLADRPELAAVRAQLLARLTAWMQEGGDPLLHGAVAGPLHHRTLDALRAAHAVAGA
ncbi:sulfatase family protein [Streptomyces endophyticus]|uniref:Sulfatase n=1 Tax=Streptomyces endophyticus TaxID=714166 RepID=A0ABU6F9Y2_9ACTN|nr:sulfatase [Streptomyces endophyticus]MEB8340743.1 sulfatase [Streptomyces endophyticus]